MRISILRRDHFTCRICGATGEKLNVHHIIYLENKEPWEYDDNYLITLCEFCHAKEHAHNVNETALSIIDAFVKTFNLPLSELNTVLYTCPTIEIHNNKPDWVIASDIFNVLRDCIEKRNDKISRMNEKEEIMQSFYNDDTNPFASDCENL